MKNQALETFGKLLMENVRDEAIKDWDALIMGNMKGQRAVRIRESLKGFTLQEKNLLQTLIPQIVDSCLFKLLRMIDNESELELRFRVDAHTSLDLKDLSQDGLSGDLLFEDGWIQKFSRERHIPPL